MKNLAVIKSSKYPRLESLTTDHGMLFINLSQDARTSEAQKVNS